MPALNTLPTISLRQANRHFSIYGARGQLRFSYPAVEPSAELLPEPDVLQQQDNLGAGEQQQDGADEQRSDDGQPVEDRMQVFQDDDDWHSVSSDWDDEEVEQGEYWCKCMSHGVLQRAALPLPVQPCCACSLQPAEPPAHLLVFC